MQLPGTKFEIFVVISHDDGHKDVFTTTGKKSFDSALKAVEWIFEIDHYTLCLRTPLNLTPRADCLQSSQQAIWLLGEDSNYRGRMSRANFESLHYH
jgi:hypothetical protein